MNWDSVSVLLSGKTLYEKAKENTIVYICSFKILGMRFATLDKLLAEEWVSQDPDCHYYNELEIK